MTAAICHLRKERYCPEGDHTRRLTHLHRLLMLSDYTFGSSKVSISIYRNVAENVEVKCSGGNILILVVGEGVYDAELRHSVQVQNKCLSAQRHLQASLSASFSLS